MIASYSLVWVSLLSCSSAHNITPMSRSLLLPSIFLFFLSTHYDTSRRIWQIVGCVSEWAETDAKSLRTYNTNNPSTQGCEFLTLKRQCLPRSCKRMVAMKGEDSYQALREEVEEQEQEEEEEEALFNQRLIMMWTMKTIHWLPVGQLQIILSSSKSNSNIMEDYRFGAQAISLQLWSYHLLFPCNCLPLWQRHLHCLRRSPYVQERNGLPSKT